MLCDFSPVLLIGLRDYGTASWEGGDAGCDHKRYQVASNLWKSAASTRGGAHKAVDTPANPYTDTCGKCGATRIDQQIGLESTVEAYVAELVAVFREVRRVLRDDGVLFLNLGDSYASAWPCNRRNEVGAGSLPNGKREARPPRMPSGLKEKDLIGVPWRVAFALQADGWYLRSDIIWAKPNPMPESVRDRPTRSHEYIFLLSKSARYFYDADAIKEPMKDVSLKRLSQPNVFEQQGGPKDPKEGNRSHRKAINNQAERLVKHEKWKSRFEGWDEYDKSLGRNARTVWTMATAPFAEAHFATFPPALAERCIKAGTSEKGACGACGAPWVRVTEPSVEYKELLARANDRGDWYPRVGTNEKRDDGTKHGKLEGGIRPDYRTTGWQPTCTCDDRDPSPDDPPTVPCVVLDPFGGAGTVSLVAERLGRDSIYIDLSSEYAAMARRRIMDECPMFTSIT